MNSYQIGGIHGAGYRENMGRLAIVEDAALNHLNSTQGSRINHGYYEWRKVELTMRVWSKWLGDGNQRLLCQVLKSQWV